MWLPAQVRKISGHDLVVRLDEKPNVERLKTMYSDDLSEVYAKIDLVDPRKARPKQRALFWALMSDIWKWSGQPTGEIKEYFYNRYTIKTYGETISLANDTHSTVSDANKLLEMVIDFMFKWQVPFKEGYELLPKEESYYMYLCCKNRICAVCGKEHAEIHHLETIGMGGNRTHVDHTKRHVMSLCHDHHQEIETIHTKAFCSKYHLPETGIKLDVETLKLIGIRGNYEEESK